MRLRLQIPCTHDLSTFPHPTSKAHSLFFTQGNLELNPAPIPLINIRNEKMKSWTHPAFPIPE